MAQLSQPLGVHPALASLYASLSDVVGVDLDSTRELTVSQQGRFKEYFSVDIEELGVYYNEFNLVFATKAVFDDVLQFLKPKDIKLVVESNEYNVFIAVYSRYNDALVTQIIDAE
jgi:hypothetical protein